MSLALKMIMGPMGGEDISYNVNFEEYYYTTIIFGSTTNPFPTVSANVEVWWS